MTENEYNTDAGFPHTQATSTSVTTSHQDIPTPRTDTLQHPNTLQHIKFEGCDSVLLAPEDYETTFNLVSTLKRELTIAQADCAAMRDKLLEINDWDLNAEQLELVQKALSSTAGKEMLAAMALKDSIIRDVLESSNTIRESCEKLKKALTPSTASELVKDGERLEYVMQHFLDFKDLMWNATKSGNICAAGRQAIDAAIAKTKE